jgi:hypothetical protein
VRLIADDVVTPGGDDVAVGREDTAMTAILDRRTNSLHLCEGFGVFSLDGRVGAVEQLMTEDLGRRLKERILE